MTNFTNAVAAVLKGADADKVADALLANVPVTKLPMTAAAKRATSPVRISKATKATTKAMRAATTKPADASPKATDAKPLPKGAKKVNVTPSKQGTFTSVDLAAEKGINAKTLRARIRRNIAKWEPLFAGEKHTFKDNVTTRKAIDALLAADA